MPSSPRSATPVCLVIRWPRELAPQSGPAQLLRRLVEDHLPATWGVESVEQAGAFESAVQLVECALLLPKTSAAAVGDVIADGVHRFDAAGRDLATLCIAGQLAQHGIRGIVA